MADLEVGDLHRTSSIARDVAEKAALLVGGRAHV
jgi:hypothetical protein